MTRDFTQKRADAFVANLELALDLPICYLCLSIVIVELDTHDGRKIAGVLRSMTPQLWAEGLAEPALAAVLSAHERGVHDADAAVAELARRGGRSFVARAIVKRLAREVSRRTRGELRIEALARERLRLSPPELN